MLKRHLKQKQLLQLSSEKNTEKKLIVNLLIVALKQNLS